jgi:hypothetical protein
MRTRGISNQWGCKEGAIPNKEKNKRLHPKPLGSKSLSSSPPPPPRKKKRK